MENLHSWSILLTFAPQNLHLSGFGAVGSAHVWGARGRWFESSNPDEKLSKPSIIGGFCFTFRIWSDEIRTKSCISHPLQKKIKCNG